MIAHVLSNEILDKSYGIKLLTVNEREKNMDILSHFKIVPPANSGPKKIILQSNTWIVFIYMYSNLSIQHYGYYGCTNHKFEVFELQANQCLHVKYFISAASVLI